MSKNMHLVLMTFHAPITHTALSWADKEDGHLNGFSDVKYWTKMAKTLEKGCFDAIFFADTPAASDQFKGNADTPIKYGVGWPTHDPMPLVAIMASATDKLGVGVTLSINGTPPYLAARRISTIDYLSQGRIGWNVVTGHMQAEHRAIGNTLTKHDERYDRADEYLEVCYALWDAYSKGSVLRDKTAGILGDPSKIKRVDYSGKFYQCNAVPAILPSPQVRPVIFQAGSSGRGMQFAVQHAEAVFAIQPNIAAMCGFKKKLDIASNDAGKKPAKILFGLHFVIGSTDEEAENRLKQLESRVPIEAALSRMSAPLGIDASKLDLDKPLEKANTDASRGMMEALSKIEGKEKGKPPTLRQMANRLGVTGGLPQVVGGPEKIADQMEELWKNSGGFGFNLSAAVKPSMIEEFVEHVVPILQKRGIVRTDYSGNTLREHLNS